MGSQPPLPAPTHSAVSVATVATIADEISEKSSNANGVISQDTHLGAADPNAEDSRASVPSSGTLDTGVSPLASSSVQCSESVGGEVRSPDISHNAIATAESIPPPDSIDVCNTAVHHVEVSEVSEQGSGKVLELPSITPSSPTSESHLSQSPPPPPPPPALPPVPLPSTEGVSNHSESEPRVEETSDGGARESPASQPPLGETADRGGEESVNIGFESRAIDQAAVAAIRGDSVVAASVACATAALRGTTASTQLRSTFLARGVPPATSSTASASSASASTPAADSNLPGDLPESNRRNLLLIGSTNPGRATPDMPTPIVDPPLFGSVSRASAAGPWGRASPVVSDSHPSGVSGAFPAAADHLGAAAKRGGKRKLSSLASRPLLATLPLSDAASQVG